MKKTSAAFIALSFVPFGSFAANNLQSDNFTKLTGAEIKTMFTGKLVSHITSPHAADNHQTDYFEANGQWTRTTYSFGPTDQKGTWNIANDQICFTTKTKINFCSDVWKIKNAEVILIEDVNYTTGLKSGNLVPAEVSKLTR